MRTYIFLSCGFFFLLFLCPRLISAVGHWMSTILPHFVWPWCEFRMHAWNVLLAAHWKCSTQKWRKNWPSAGHHRTTLSGYIFANKACIDNRKKFVKQQYLPHISLQHGKLRPTSGWDRFVSLRHPSKFQRLSRLGSVTARYSSSRRQPNFAVLNRGRHLYSAGRPSRSASAHILVDYNVVTHNLNCNCLSSSFKRLYARMHWRHWPNQPHIMTDHNFQKTKFYFKNLHWTNACRWYNGCYRRQQ